MPPSKFPSDGVQFFSAFVQFIGAAILTHCLSRRVASEQLTSLRHIMSMPLARVALLLIFLDSWLFLFSGSMVIFGAGLERSVGACAAASYFCIFFYATSKATIYFFLVEKMHIVWQPIGGRSRLKSPLYLLCMASAIGYLVLFILLLVARYPAFIDETGMCNIGIKPFVTWSLFAFDLYINILLTALFVIPLWRFRRRTNHVLKRVTQRTLVASFISLSVSTANILALTLMHGKQRAWLCLTTCALDIIINALAVFWATTPTPQTAEFTEPRSSNGPTMPEFAKPHRGAATTQFETTQFGTNIGMDMTRSAVQIMTTTETQTDVPVQFPSDSHSEILHSEQDISTLKSGIKSNHSLHV